MKNILLHLWDDAGRDDRLQTALDLARAHGAHLTCLQVTPFTAYVASDMFGGVIVMADIMEKVRQQEELVRETVEARLRDEDVSWSYQHCDGDVASAITAQSRLSDLILLGRPLLEDDDYDKAPAFVGDVVLHARAPVLALPRGVRGFDPGGGALVAWNGSYEAANALRAAIPMLRQAGKIELVTVDAEGEFPALAAAEYLSRHGIHAEIAALRRGGRDNDVAASLLRAIEESQPAFVVQGAYGHSRAREYVFGGVTRRMMDACPIPLFMTH